MKEYSTFQERNEFEEQLFEVIQEYLGNKESYISETGTETGNPGLCINPKNMEVTIDVIGNLSDGCDFYSLEQFMRPTDDNSGMEPDCDATHELASSYCFIR